MNTFRGLPQGLGFLKNILKGFKKIVGFKRKKFKGSQIEVCI